MQPGDNQDAAATAATPPRPDALPADSVAAPPGLSRRDRRSRWLWAGGVVISAGILTGLFWLGTTMAPAPVALPVSPSASPDGPVPSSPSPPPIAPGSANEPVAAGEHGWDQLRGGECLAPFDSPWAEAFTVVSCDQPHDAQMVFTAVFPGEPDAPYPGSDALAEQIILLCSTPDVIDFAAAVGYSDIRVEGTYPLTQVQWDQGQRNQYCFVTRSGGDPIEGSLAGH